jgi:hypothetical protein
MLHAVSRRKDAASSFSVAMLPWEVARLGHAACCTACLPLQVASGASAVLQCECCTLHRACGMLVSSPSDGALLMCSATTVACYPYPAGARRSSLWRSPILKHMYALAGEADRAGGGWGWRFAVWWRGEDIWIWRINRVQGRQHRTLFCGARSSLLTVVRVA